MSGRGSRRWTRGGRQGSLCNDRVANNESVHLLSERCVVRMRLQLYLLLLRRRRHATITPLLLLQIARPEGRARCRRKLEHEPDDRDEVQRERHRAESNASARELECGRRRKKTARCIRALVSLDKIVALGSAEALELEVTRVESWPGFHPFQARTRISDNQKLTW
jgi:hypothetical protein